MTFLNHTAATMATLAVFALPVVSVAQPQNQGKVVKVKLHNSTTAPMSVKNGGEPMTIAAGESRDLKVKSGTTITTSTDGQTDIPAVQVTDQMNGATINLR